MKLFGRREAPDAGRGSLADYDYDLRPKKTDVVIRAAESDPHQDEIRRTLDLDADELFAMITRRSQQDEAVDAPMPVRLFGGGRVSGVVGIVPRGMEAPVDETIGRLLGSPNPRIPVEIATTKNGLRVDLLIGRTR
ncbi:MAG: hypothetical protein RI885_1136 [Actinomycetota bacterium]|jgi:hypothetical protein